MVHNACIAGDQQRVERNPDGHPPRRASRSVTRGRAGVWGHLGSALAGCAWVILWVTFCSG